MGSVLQASGVLPWLHPLSQATQKNASSCPRDPRHPHPCSFTQTQVQDAHLTIADLYVLSGQLRPAKPRPRAVSSPQSLGNKIPQTLGKLLKVRRRRGLDSRPHRLSQVQSDAPRGPARSTLPQNRQTGPRLRISLKDKGPRPHRPWLPRHFPGPN